jgi:hypothetical protein
MAMPSATRATGGPGTLSARYSVEAAQVGYTGSDDDRHRWLAARIWLDRNDPDSSRLWLRADNGARCHAIDLRGNPPRDFLEESSTYDVVVIHNLWGIPGYSVEQPGLPARCSPLHSTQAWRGRLAAAGARYIFLFGSDFNAISLGGPLPNYETVSVPFHSSLDVLVAGSAAGLRRAAEPIGYRDVNRARLATLPDFKRNSALDLSYTDVRPQDLRDLGTMHSLKDLRLVGVPISAAAVRLIAAWDGLVYLNLDETGLQSGWLDTLAGLGRIEAVSLNHNAIGDPDTDVLSRLTSLRWLSLIETQVGDCGLRRLRELPHLEWLSLVDSHVTAAGTEAFRKARPQCAVQSNCE